jgi:soluble lytic murein transglycosylase-like protein
LEKILRCALITMVAGGFAQAVHAGDELTELRARALDGSAAALTELATRYENAEGVPRDSGVARRLFCAAARKGDSEAQFRLGWVYAYARGVAHDDGVAAALFRLAADQGHEGAAKALRYISERPGTEMPRCMRPERPAVVSMAVPQGEGVEAQAEARHRAPKEVVRLVESLAPKYGVDPDLALAIISVESDYDASAISPRTAQGLMQLMPETAQRFRVKSPLDPADNVTGGLAYVRWLLAFFRGDVRLVLAAYNAGERAVEKYRGIPPYAETRVYVDKVSRLYGKARHPFDPARAAPSRVLARLPR